MAVPVNERTRTIIGTLAAGRAVRHAYLGIGGGSRPLPPAVATASGFFRGVEVVSVVTSSPAATAGLRPRDVVVTWTASRWPTSAALQSLLTERFIGRPVAIGYVRDGRLGDVPGTLRGAAMTPIPRGAPRYL